MEIKLLIWVNVIIRGSSEVVYAYLPCPSSPYLNLLIPILPSPPPCPHCGYWLADPGNINYVAFISIRQYRDIDSGIGDLSIIAATRDHTISCTCHVCSALLARHKPNSQQHLHDRA